MSSEHKRPLYAFAIVALLCAVFVGNGLRSDALTGLLRVAELPMHALDPRPDAQRTVTSDPRADVPAPAASPAPPASPAPRARLAPPATPAPVAVAPDAAQHRGTAQHRGHRSARSAAGPHGRTREQARGGGHAENRGERGRGHSQRHSQRHESQRHESQRHESQRHGSRGKGHARGHRGHGRR